MHMTKRPGKIIKATTIDDLPIRNKREPKIDFHAIIPVSLHARLEKATEETGYMRNELIIIALEAFLNYKKP